MLENLNNNQTCQPSADIVNVNANENSTMDLKSKATRKTDSIYVGRKK